MKMVAIYNIKGGVGKTSTAVNIAWLAAQSGLRTLVWDLDPQGATTFYFRIKAKVKGGPKRFFDRSSDLTRSIKATDFEDLDLLPADFSNRHFDLSLDHQQKPVKAFKRIIKPFERDYDLILLDCPPSISLMSEAVFQSVDALLVPTIPTTLSLRTLVQLVRVIRELPKQQRPRLWPFFSMVDVRKKMHRDLIVNYTHKKTRLLKSWIPYASDVELMGLKRAPLFTYAPSRSRSAQALNSLWLEIEAKLHI